jgi:peroxiredoxin
MHQGTDFPLPANLPRPADDGAADHLEGMAIPNISLNSTFGGTVELARVRAPRIVVYCYPMTGVPGKALPEGWDHIPGARGCTPQASNFQEHYGRFFDLGVDVFGLSTQCSQYQREMAKRLNLPFEILSDAEFKFCDALRLPTFEVDGMRLLKRLTLAIRDARIEHAFYPVFPPDRSADEVLEWLNDHPLPT